MTYPTIKLAGKDWPVKELVLAQLRVVEPAWARVRDAKGIITERVMDDLIEICYQAVAPLSEPPMKRADFLNLPVTLKEMVEALDTVSQQAGMVRSEGGAAGEVPAGSLPTSTAS